MTKLLGEIGLIAMLEPLLVALFAQAGSAVPGFDMTGITNLGATAVVSLLLVWVVTKDRPAERDAFLEQLALNQKMGFEALAASRTDYLSQLTAARAEALQERALDSELRRDIADRMHEALAQVNLKCPVNQKQSIG